MGGDPDVFWRQTPASYVVIMEGMVRAATRKVDVAILTAWHTAIFALSGYAGKLQGKQLSDFLSSAQQPENDHRLKRAEAIAFFHRLKAKGVSVEITRH